MSGRCILDVRLVVKGQWLTNVLSVASSALCLQKFCIGEEEAETAVFLWQAALFYVLWKSTCGIFIQIFFN